MKFGKEIQSIASGDPWAPFYLDYKGLKKVLNSLAKGRPLDAALLAAIQRPPRIQADEFDLLPPQLDESTLLQTHRAAFFFKLERELEKINEFYLKKEAELKLRLRNLIDKRKRLQDAVVQSGFHLSRSSSSWVALHEGFRHFERDLAKLQGFIDINATGFRKILKKWDKRSKSTTKELYLSRQVEAQPCFNRAFITELSNSSTANMQKLQQLSQTDLSSLGTNADPSADHLPEDGSNVTQGLSQLDFLDDLEIALEQAVVARDGESAKTLLDALPTAETPDQRTRIQRLSWRMISLSPSDSTCIPSSLLDFDFVDDINARTCLHEMARLGKLDLVHLAVAHGASPQAKDVFLRQPLHYAAMNGFADVVQVLVTGDTAVEPDVDGQTPLTYAIINGHFSTVRLLLPHHTARHGTEETQSYQLLHLASQHGRSQICELLMASGIPLEADDAGYFPHHHAARQGHAECLDLLLKQGKADPNQVDKYANWTALIHAAAEGHSDCARILIDAGAKIDIQDEDGRTAVHWAAWQGHIDCLNLLLRGRRPSMASRVIEQLSKSPGTDSGTGSIDELDDAEIDLIPSLSLPPPIIPFRVYGHNYLDNKSLIQINLGHYNTSLESKAPVTFAEPDAAVPVKLVISCLSDSSVMPHICALENGDEDQTPISFQVADISSLVLAFDLFPVHGSRMIGRAHASASVLAEALSNTKALSIPIVDYQLNHLGDVHFELSAITAFAAAELAPGGHMQTYWKSSAPHSAQHSTANQVVASSLQGEYIKVVVQVTKDGVPVAWPVWDLPVPGINLGVMDVTLSQFLQLSATQKKELVQPATANARDWYAAISDAMVPLETLLQLIPKNLGINIELRYPTLSDCERLGLRTPSDANRVIDAVLTIVYDVNKQNTIDGPEEESTADRRIVFSSFNPLVATALNWKQPNCESALNLVTPTEESASDAVFFASYCGLSRSAPEGKLLPANRQEMDKRCTTIREAVRFAKANNLLGVLFDSTVFKQVPTLVDATKDHGLLLVTFGFESRDTLRLGSDAHLENGVISYASQKFLAAV